METALPHASASHAHQPPPQTCSPCQRLPAAFKPPSPLPPPASVLRPAFVSPSLPPPPTTTTRTTTTTTTPPTTSPESLLAHPPPCAQHPAVLSAAVPAHHAAAPPELLLFSPLTSNVLELSSAAAPICACPPASPLEEGTDLHPSTFSASPKLGAALPFSSTLAGASPPAQSETALPAMPPVPPVPHSLVGVGPSPELRVSPSPSSTFSAALALQSTTTEKDTLPHQRPCSTPSVPTPLDPPVHDPKGSLPLSSTTLLDLGNAAVPPSSADFQPRLLASSSVQAPDLKRSHLFDSAVRSAAEHTHHPSLRHAGGPSVCDPYPTTFPGQALLLGRSSSIASESASGLFDSFSSDMFAPPSSSVRRESAPVFHDHLYPASSWIKEHTGPHHSLAQTLPNAFSIHPNAFRVSTEGNQDRFNERPRTAESVVHAPPRSVLSVNLHEIQEPQKQGLGSISTQDAPSVQNVSQSNDDGASVVPVPNLPSTLESAVEPEAQRRTISVPSQHEHDVLGGPALDPHIPQFQLQTGFSVQAVPTCWTPPFWYEHNDSRKCGPSNPSIVPGASPDKGHCSLSAPKMDSELAETYAPPQRVESSVPGNFAPLFAPDAPFSFAPPDQRSGPEEGIVMAECTSIDSDQPSLDLRGSSSLVPEEGCHPSYFPPSAPILGPRGSAIGPRGSIALTPRTSIAHGPRESIAMDRQRDTAMDQRSSIDMGPRGSISMDPRGSTDSGAQQYGLGNDQLVQAPPPQVVGMKRSYDGVNRSYLGQGQWPPLASSWGDPMPGRVAAVPYRASADQVAHPHVVPFIPRQASLPTYMPLSGFAPLGSRSDSVDPNGPVAPGASPADSTACSSGSNGLKQQPMLFQLSAPLPHSLAENRPQGPILSPTSSQRESVEMLWNNDERTSSSHGKGKTNNKIGPYTCDYTHPLNLGECGVVFHRFYDLARHRESIHAKEEARLVSEKCLTLDQCNVLGKEFDVQRTAEAEWRCDGPKGCGSKFSRKDALLRHRRLRDH